MAQKLIGLPGRLFVLILLSLLCWSGCYAADFVFPIADTAINSNYGNRVHPIRKVVRHHSGIDLAADYDTPIRAIAGGVVVFADKHGGYGNYISIMHSDLGISSHYAHCRAIKVRTGQTIRAGEVIGTVGSTGGSTGPHLHLEIRRDGKSLDPLKFIPDLTAEAAG